MSSRVKLINVRRKGLKKSRPSPYMHACADLVAICHSCMPRCIISTIVIVPPKAAKVGLIICVYTYRDLWRAFARKRESFRENRVEQEICLTASGRHELGHRIMGKFLLKRKSYQHVRRQCGQVISPGKPKAYQRLPNLRRV